MKSLLQESNQPSMQIPADTLPAGTDPDRRLISETQINAIYNRIKSFQALEGRLMLVVYASWWGELRWARNRVSVNSDRRDVWFELALQGKLGVSSVTCNQVDDASLTAAVRVVEQRVKAMEGMNAIDYDGLYWRRPLLPFPETTIWSDATFHATSRQRSALAQTLTERAEQQKLVSAGFLQMRVYESLEFGIFGSGSGSNTVTPFPDDQHRDGTGAQRMTRDPGYVRLTESQCSMTVRHPKGVGSGWAGLSSYDWSAIDAPSLATGALERCIASLNPVAIEPGRYTAILEPPAVASLTFPLIGALQSRSASENKDQPGTFSLNYDEALGLRLTKLGLKILDERISISHDPIHPQLGIVPELGLGPVTWIEHGVLRTLGYVRDRYDNDYSLPLLNENLPVVGRHSYRMSGGEATIDEMIESTKRGIWVSRFSGVRRVPFDGGSLLVSGFTRDGLWLIENGKISKAVKNMKFTDSPLFALNQVEQLGVPVPVFNPDPTRLNPVIVPPLKVNDFAFTATTDAI